MMTTDIVSIAHDIGIFLEMSDRLGKESIQKSKDIDLEYGVSSIDWDSDDGSFEFDFDAERYRYDYGSEELYKGHDIDWENPVREGRAHEYICKRNAVSERPFRELEREFDRRGWIYDPDDYSYNLYKDGWVVDFGYWASSWDEVYGEGGGDIIHESDDPWSCW